MSSANGKDSPIGVGSQWQAFILDNNNVATATSTLIGHGSGPVLTSQSDYLSLESPGGTKGRRGASSTMKNMTSSALGTAASPSPASTRTGESLGLWCMIGGEARMPVEHVKQGGNA